MTDEELTNLIADAIDESMDVDWTSRDGASHVLGALQVANALPVWRDMTDTAWLEGKDVVLFVKGMEVSARYCPGEWTDHHEGREYNGPVWSCFDDAFQLEIEETSPDAAEWFHDGATHWRLPTPPEN